MQSVSWHLDLLYSIKEMVSTLKLKCITVGSLCNTSLGFHWAEGFPLWSILRYIFSKKTFTFLHCFHFIKERGHHRIKVRCAETLILFIFKKWMVWTLISFYYYYYYFLFSSSFLFFPWALKAWENTSKPIKDSIHIFRSSRVDQLTHCSFLSVPYFLT